MTVTVESGAPRTLAEADLQPRGPVCPSPRSWRDQIVYFLLPDRFSDGGEAERPLFRPGQFGIADKAAWMTAGKRFQGGTLQGVRSKLPYLRDLGVSALWLGPVWRQRAEVETYHGYAIQNFLDVDPRFGTRQDLRDLVDAAHDLDLYVLLDVIYNHTGDNWFYEVDGRPHSTVDYRFQPPWPFHGWRAHSGASIPHGDQIAPADGVWPAEFQSPDWYTRAGRIGRWDPAHWEHSQHPHAEFRRGDFYELKDLKTNELEPGSQEVLAGLVRVYQYWIAVTDCDGFRIDTVKHVSWEASRNFCGAIHEYAESIGKDNFLLLGEVTGGAGMARDYLEVFGRNLDAVLDIGAPAAALAGMAKGFRHPAEFFAQFKEHDALGTHRQVGRYHVSVLDDHDMVGKPKARFAAGNDASARHDQLAHAVGVQLTTLGIPCIYYGTEQAFDGSAARHDFAIEPPDDHGNISHEDRYLRESMFGGSFGAFATEGCHFFDPEHPVYLRIAALARLRRGAGAGAVGLALRRGRQYPRETSFLDRPFRIPGPGELIAWSRVLFDTEVLIALNPHGAEARGAWVTVDSRLHPEGASMPYLYDSRWPADQLTHPPATAPLPIIRQPNGRAVVRVDLPPAGMAVLANPSLSADVGNTNRHVLHTARPGFPSPVGDEK